MNTRKTPRNLILFFAVLLSGCTKYEPAVISNNKVSLELWSNWEFKPGVGDDSYVGTFTDGKESIEFDYGMLTFGGLNSIQETPEMEYYEELTINGVPAKITKEMAGESIRLNLYSDKGDGENRTWLCVYNPSDDQKFIAIFKTLQYL